MDFGNAALVVGVVLILTASVKDFLPAVPERFQPTVVRIFALLVGWGALLIMRETQWADKQVIEGVSVASMSVWDCFACGLFLGVGAAGFLHEALKAIHNIGANKTDGPA